MDNDQPEEIDRDTTRIYPRIRRAAIDYLTSSTSGMGGAVSNTKLRKWGYYGLKRARIERQL